MPDLPAPDSLPTVAAAFPEFSAECLERLGRLTALVRDWNARVNLVSRKDVEHLEVHHLLHSLLAIRHWQPAAGADVADLGTGGGFPGLPLAVVYPQCRFTLVDSIGKKGRTVRSIAAALGLENVRVEICRAEQLRGRFDYVFGRAVTALPRFLGWAAPLLRAKGGGETPNGVLYFKGTRWRDELAGTGIEPATIWDLHALCPDPFFAEKFLLHFPAPLRLPR